MWIRTWVSDANSNAAPLELGAIQFEGLFQTFECSKLDITETFGLAVQFILYYSDACDLATCEEIFNIAVGGIERQVAQVGSIRWFRREWEFLADRECALAAA